MTVERLAVDKCAAWTYLDERDEVCVKIVVQDGDGEWMEIDNGGCSTHMTAERLRKFIDDWIDDAKIDPAGCPMPTDDTIAVYRAAADFIAASS